jgi:glycosyltransferase involved in cell wall biosynthesis
LRILLLSAYDAASHRRWRQGLVAQFSQHDWQVLSLPPRHFSWRIRGNGLSWALSARQVLEQHYDLLVATSMVDLATLKGLVPALAATPSVVYFHENQFAYPHTESAHASVEPQMVTLYAALAADRIVFNSEYNRSTFFQGVGQLLAKFPDEVPDGVVDLLVARSEVLPVPLEIESLAGAAKSSSADGPLHVIWNHRWEYDKGPGRLLAVVTRLLDSQVDFEISVLGEQFRERPQAFGQLKTLLDSHAGRLRRWGFMDSTDAYRRHLRSGDVLLSTTLHDFQGLAVLEGVAAGCLPLVPDRLAYPEWFSEEFRYPSLPDDEVAESGFAADALAGLARAKRLGNLIAPPDLRGMAWPALAGRYASLLSAFT